MKKIITTCMLVMSFAPAVIMAASVPSLINYQGRLLDTNSVPVNGNVAVTIGLYTNISAGGSVYTENVGSVAVENGIYSFSWGTNSTAVSAALAVSEAWLEVSLDGTPLSPRQRLISVPYAVMAQSVNETQLTDSTENLLNLVIELQHKVMSLQVGSTGATSSAYFVNDIFSDADGVNNTVNIANSVAYYNTIDAYYASAVARDPATYGPNAYIFWVKAQDYAVANEKVPIVFAELQLDTQCYPKFIYSDVTTNQSATQVGSGNTTWVQRMWTNPEPTKAVSDIEIWVRKPSSLANNQAHVRYTELVYHKPVNIEVNVPSSGGSVSASQLSVVDAREPGDAITYSIGDDSLTNSTLPTATKNIHQHEVSSNIKMEIVLTPAAITNSFTFGDTRVQSYVLKLWYND